MNIAIFLRTSILKDIWEWLLLLGVVFVLRNAWRKFKVLWNFDDFFSIFLRTLEAIFLNQASCKSHSSTICLSWAKRNDYYDVIISEYLQYSKIVDGETKNINIGENQIKKCITILGNSFWSIFFFLIGLLVISAIKFTSLNLSWNHFRFCSTDTEQKMKFSIKDCFSKCDQIRRNWRYP